MKIELTKLLSSIIKVKDFNHSLLNSLSKIINNFVIYQEQSKLENKILENVSNINSSTNINIQLKEIKIILKV